MIGWENYNKAPMNICEITNKYRPYIGGGAEQYATRISEALAESGHDVSVITADHPEKRNRTGFRQEEIKGVDVYRFLPGNMYSPVDRDEMELWKKGIQQLVDIWNPHCYWMVRKKLNEISPDIVHIHTFGGLSPSVFRAAYESDATVFHHLHNYALLHVHPSMFIDGQISEPTGLTSLYTKINRKLVDSYIDCAISPSQFVLEKHREYGFFQNSESVRIPYGVPGSTNNLKEKYRATKEGLNLLFVGRITQSKGLDILIDAVDQLECELHVDIVGDGPVLEELESRASEEIEFHGFLDYEQIEQFYLEADYTVVPSRWYDNSPIVIYESFVHGTPVIGADIGGIPELIKSGKTGYLFEPENPRALASVIGKVSEETSGELFEETYSASRKLLIDNHARRLSDFFTEYRYPEQNSDNSPT